MGYMVDRTLRDLSDEDIEKIAGTYHAWRTGDGDYEDESGYSKSADLEEISHHGFILTPGRYVGAPDVDDDGEPFEEKMERLTLKLAEQFEESARLEHLIKESLKKLGY